MRLYFPVYGFQQRILSHRIDTRPRRIWVKMTLHLITVVLYLYFNVIHQIKDYVFRWYAVKVIFAHLLNEFYVHFNISDVARTPADRKDA